MIWQHHASCSRKKKTTTTTPFQAAFEMLVHDGMKVIDVAFGVVDVQQRHESIANPKPQ
jgi:hypothetical protein